MKVEQALEYFKRRRDAMQLMEEDAAIWALEKQIPKKPITETVNRGISVSGEYDIDFNYLCPNCTTVVGDYETNDFFYKFCPECGQALDWGKRPINYEIYFQNLTALMNRYNDDNENCITCKDCLNYGPCAAPFKCDDNTSVYFCDEFVNKNCSDIELKEKTK